MKTLTRIAAFLALALTAFAQQNSILQTSLSAAVTATATQIRVASATGINAPTATVPGSSLFIQDVGQTGGELVQVSAVSGTTISVVRSNRVTSHASGAMVLVATVPNWFYVIDPQGSCVTAQTYASPYVNVSNGNQWKCSTQTLTWVPYWGTAGTPQLLTATATASVAGATAIAGPLVEISGTEAITSFTMSTGWNGHGFCVQPTAAFTTVAGNNIAEASTADANQTLCFVWNARAGTFTASY